MGNTSRRGKNGAAEKYFMSAREKPHGGRGVTGEGPKGEPCPKHRERFVEKIAGSPKV